VSINYYAHLDLGKPVVKLHIGKSSAGWCFALHVTDEITSLDDWRKAWSCPWVTIVDEYGDTVTLTEMLTEITDRSWSGPRDRGSPWWDQNHALPGLLGLLRQTHNATLPPNPETDTYDLCFGDFS